MLSFIIVSVCVSVNQQDGAFLTQKCVTLLTVCLFFSCVLRKREVAFLGLKLNHLRTQDYQNSVTTKPRSEEGCKNTLTKIQKNCGQLKSCSQQNIIA